MITGAANQDQSAHVEDMPLWAQKRDVALDRVTARAERTDVLFSGKATTFILHYLQVNGATSSEKITDACKRAGIIPPDDRAFGPIYLSLARAGLIIKTGVCIRKKGHGTSGGNIWRLAP